VLAGSYRSVFRGSGIEFDEVREYVPGDARRSIDWSVTARTGRPHVRKYIDERERTMMLALDLSASMDAGSCAWSPRAFAARICATLAMAAVRNSDRIGLLGFSDQVEVFVPPRKGTQHVLELVRDCLSLRAERPTTALAPALDFITRAIPRHATVVVISDFLDRDWRTSMAKCARRHDLIAARILDHSSLAERGMVRVAAAEAGARRIVDLGSPAVRAAVRTRQQERDLLTESELRRAGVDRLDFLLPKDADPNAVARPLRAFFRMRLGRGARR
jgi:uncharacterized protein (DUF58 family)